MRKESTWRKGASRLLVLVLTLAVILTFSFTNVSFAEDGTSTGSGNTTTSGGGVSASKVIIPNNTYTSVNSKTGKPTYTIQLTLNGNSYTSTTTTPAEANVVLVLDKSGSMTMCGSKSFTEIWKWGRIHCYRCEKCKAEYWEKPDVCTNQISGENTRMAVAKSAAHSFIDQILAKGNNHLGIVAFDGYRGGYDETSAVQSQNLGSSASELRTFVDGLSAKGGTNYSAALNEARKMLSGSGLPSYIVFISDGEPGKAGGSYLDRYWNGLNQADDLKEHGTKIFSIGIGDQISTNAANVLTSLASDGNYTQISDSNLSTGLPNVLAGLADTITSANYPAAKNLKMTDIVNTEKFDLVSGSLPPDLSNDNGTLTWDLGDFPAAGTASESRSVTFQITPKNDAYDKINTNSDVSVSYEDYLSGEKKTISKDQIGDPEVELYKAVYLDSNGEEIKYFGGLASLDNPPKPSENPTKKGYTFAGWDDGTLSEKGYVKKFKPKWTKNQVTISYDLNGGSGDVPKSVKADINSTAKVSDAKVTRENYTFAGWKSSSDGITYKGGDSIDVGEENITLTAQWKENSKVKVLYDLNKGKADKDGNPKDTEVYENKDYTISNAAVTRENYVFAGWKSSSDGITYKGGDSINVGKKGVTLTAQWKEDKNNNGIADEDEDKYTVTYTDGVGQKAFEDKVYGNLLSGTATPKFENPTWKDHVFAGWDKKIADQVTEDATYKAQWKDDKNNNGKADDEEKKYTVTYSDGVNGTVFPDQVTEGLLEGAATPAFQGIVPNRKDYVFANWKPVVSPTVTGDVTYVAQWKDDKNNNGKADDTEEKYTVTYKDGADQKVFKDQTYKDLLSGTATPTIEEPKWEGHVFAGWSPSVSKTVTGNATYTAQWKDDKNNNGKADDTEQKYTVTYKDGADQKAFKDKVFDGLLFGTATPKFENPTWKDHVFAGWDKDIAEKVKESVTYTATWKDDKNNNGKADDTEEKYTVTYKDGADQKVFKDQTYKDLLSETATPAFKGTTTRSGYKFSGWTPKLDEKVTKNVIYTAVWTKEETPVKPSEPVTPVTPVTPVKPAEEHTVTITPNNGQPDIIQTVPDGGNAVEPDDLKKDGYTIDGYYTDPEMTKAFDFSQPIKSSTHVYVKWTKTNKPIKPQTGKKVTGILLPKVIAAGKHTQTLTWTALKNVDGYFIYTNHCDKADKEYPFKKAATYKASKARVYKVKNLKTGHNYKYYVAAYKIKNGKKVVVRNSVTVHSVAGNTSARSTNVKSVKAKKHSITLKKGKSCTLKASISKMNKKRAFLDSTHCGLLRYLSADSRIATVDYNTGKITAKKAGKTTVYVLGVNGIRGQVHSKL
jgi:uncharacterized repeat protein (TIGR02543 family)